MKEKFKSSRFKKLGLCLGAFIIGFGIVFAIQNLGDAYAISSEEVQSTNKCYDCGAGFSGGRYIWTSSPPIQTCTVTSDSLCGQADEKKCYVCDSQTNIVQWATNPSDSNCPNGWHVSSSISQSNCKYYTIAYNLNEGSGTATKQYKRHGATITINSTTPTKKGYTFTGWKSSVDGHVYNSGDNYMQNGDTIFTAQWIANSQCYVCDNATNIVQWATNPSDSNCPNTWHASSDISQSNCKYYTITYDFNGGYGSLSKQYKRHGSDITINSTTPIKTGYTFVGWKATNGTAYKNGSTYKENSNTTLTAQWTETTSNKCYVCDSQTNIVQWATNPSDSNCPNGWHASSDISQSNCKYYTITYDLNGGSGSANKQYKRHGLNITINSTTPTKTGYTFVGWKASTNGTVYKSGSSYTINNNTTLTAQWTETTINKCYDCGTSSATGSRYVWTSSPPVSTCTVTSDTTSNSCLAKNESTSKSATIYIDANGGSCTGCGTKTYTGNFYFSNINISKSGYTLKGWQKKGTSQIFKQYVDTSENGSTFVAIWEKTSTAPTYHTITYYKNDGTDSVYTTQNVQSGSLITAPTEPTRDGYMFINWSAKSDGTPYNMSTKVTGNINLWACWKKIEQEELPEGEFANYYTVNYDLDDGIFPTKEKTRTEIVTSGNKATLPAINPIKEGYKFIGWYLKEEKYNFDKEVTSDMTLKAKYSKLSDNKKYICQYEDMYDPAVEKCITVHKNDGQFKDSLVFTTTYNREVECANGRNKNISVTCEGGCNNLKAPNGFSRDSWIYSDSCKLNSSCVENIGSCKVSWKGYFYNYYDATDKNDNNNVDKPDNNKDSNEDKTKEEIKENIKTGNAIILLISALGVIALSGTVYYYTRKKKID